MSGSNNGTGSDTAAAPNLANRQPIDPADPAHAAWFGNLQGNILSGHGRDHTVHIFARLPDQTVAARALIGELAEHVTSARKQEIERQEFKAFHIPGSIFGNLFLSANGYRRLGFDDQTLRAAFTEPMDQPRPTDSNFLDGMAQHAVSDLGDPPPAEWEQGFNTSNLDFMLLLADDDEGYLGRRAREVIDRLAGRCEVMRIERGKALRNDEDEGIEHFGYVDGRSQPLFLTSDFANLENGVFDPNTTEKGGGRIDIWQPFEPLKLVLLPDILANRPDCLGSYFVFRKLEQNVRDFLIEEQRLADTLGLQGSDRERAGAMVVGRFRDGTPLVLSQTDGFIPTKENNFRFDGAQGDPEALRCPFHAHIRKTNPRGDIGTQFGASEAAERDHRIARRGITYGERNRLPNAFQALDDLPSKDVGLLFMCFQASIRNQFAFMQRGWANNQAFVKRGPNGEPITGIDPVIGQLDSEQAGGAKVALTDQTWLPEYGKTDPKVRTFFGNRVTMRNFVTMRGGEFFFAPSIPFLRGLAT